MTRLTRPRIVEGHGRVGLPDHDPVSYDGVDTFPFAASPLPTEQRTCQAGRRESGQTEGDAMYACSEPSVAALPADDRTKYQEKSVYKDVIEEEDRHKWIESERAGYDLGEAVIKRWVKEHWTGYLRSKWVEHLQGQCFWSELDRANFGILQREFHDCPHLLDLIMKRLISGEENLHLIVHAIWTRNDDFPLARMLEILTSLDVNSRRLRHRFEDML